MNKVIIQFAILMAVIAVVFIGIYSIGIIQDEDGALFSIQQEKKLGKLIADEILTEADVIEDETINAYCDSINKIVIAGLDTQKFEYKIFLVNSPQINAISLPGGNIIVYTGLLEFAKTPEEYASVLAHELGHSENRDVLSSIVKNFGIALLVSAATGNGNVGELAQSILSNTFNRKQEANADEFAFKVLARIGVRTKHFASFFKRLERNNRMDENMEIMYTHPVNKKRIEAANKFKVPKNFKEKKLLQTDWDTVKAELPKY